MIAFIIIFVFLLLFTLKAVRVVPTDHVEVVERLGKVAGTRQAGMYVIVPFIDRAKRYSLAEQTLEVSPGRSVRYRIVDAERAHTSVANLEDAIRQMVANRTTDKAQQFGLTILSVR